MFTFQMISLELNGIFDVATVIKSDAYQAMVHATNVNDSMCETKLADLESKTRELNKLLQELRQKMDFLKSQS
jgi:hypothetical protein